MSSPGSVTALLGQLKAGDDVALARLNQRYWPFLVDLARRKLKPALGHHRDESDVANQALWNLYQAIKEGRIPRLQNRHDLLALLTVMVTCQAVNQIKHELAQKRDRRKVIEESVLPLLEDEAYTPLQQVLLRDLYEHFLNALPEKLRPFAELYLAGYTHKEIADHLGCVERTVNRKIPLILARWQVLAADSVHQEVGALVQTARPQGGDG